MKKILLMLALLIGVDLAVHAEPRFYALVVFENGGHHVPYSRRAVEWLNKLATDSGFMIDYVHDMRGIDDSALSKYKLFIQLDYPPYGWPDSAMQALRSRLEDGTIGWIGFHHASLIGEFDGYPMWDWFSDFMGGIQWKGYIKEMANGLVDVEGRQHPVMQGLPESFVIEKEEWYIYDRNPRANVHVLASVDEGSYDHGTDVRMGDHPVVWTNDRVKARNVYIFMGHGPELFDKPVYTTLFRNAIFWASAPTAVADSGRYILHKFAQPLGKETYTVTRNDSVVRYSIDFKFVDRGSSVPLKSVIEVTAGQEPRSLYMKGSTSRISTILDSVVVAGGVAQVKIDDSTYTEKLRENSTLVAGYSPVTAQMLLLQYWKTHHQPSVIHAIPGGDIVIQSGGKDIIAADGKAIGCNRYVISGLVWGNEMVWTDDNGQLICLITNDAEGDKLEAVLEPYESLLPVFIDKAAVYGMQLFDEMTRSGSAPHAAIVITNARVLDIERGVYDSAMNIVVDKGKISKLGRGKVVIPKGAVVIDAGGKVVMPGLWDMHAHFEQAEWGPAYLAAGITTVRDCGNEFGYINSVKAAIDHGHGIGPHILKAGIIDGKGPMSLGMIQAATPEEAVKAVNMYKDNGFDQIKIYSSVRPEIVKAICAEAHRLGLTVTGHIPEGMNLRQGVDSGMDMVNHEQYVNALLKKRPDRTIDLNDSANAALFKFILDRHVVVDPTLSVFEWVFRSTADPVTAIEPSFYEVPAPLRALFSNTGMPPAQAVNYAQVMKNIKLQVAAMYKMGVPIVAGTDMGIPGYSLYRELELYVEGGLTPREALRTATSIPAQVMKKEAVTGAVRVGLDADLIIVDGDPLANIRDLRRLQTVIKGDRVYDPRELHRMVGFK